MSPVGQQRKFKDALRGGHDAERRWVEEIRESGLSVCHGKKLIVKEHSKLTGHVDSPDALALMSIEIKERLIRFTGPDEFPYPTVIVDDLRGMRMEKIKHFAYVYISRPTGRWAWLCGLDRNDTWLEEVTFDRGRGHAVPVLTAPKSYLRSAESLMEFLYPHTLLGLVDGDTECFRYGGGEAEERDRYVAPPN